ncbi:MAG: amidohydrolase family protein, partial [Dehalococcoidia bacterium]
VGVTTVLDLAGNAESLLEGAAEAGAGLNIAFLEPIVPGGSVAGPDPAHAELSDVVGRARVRGALGVKVLGGHYPLTPEATARAIRAANEHGAYVAVHAGTTAHGSDIDGLEELIQLAEGLPLHVAHVNSYCRGQRTGDPVGESHRALRVVGGAPNVRSESYLSIQNGTSGQCVDGVPASNVTKTCLEMGGYEPTESGVAEAILAGWAGVQVTRSGETRLVSGPDGETIWRERGTNVGLSFAVNPPVSSLIMATAKDQDGAFIVDAISTDGGAIPRNVIVEQGLPLVRFGALRLEEFVRKTSVNPAAMLGTAGKGHLGVGADADVTVLDLDAGRATLAVAGGDVIMVDGVPVGRGARFITTTDGFSFLRERWEQVHIVRDANRDT